MKLKINLIYLGSVWLYMGLVIGMIMYMDLKEK